MTTRDRFQGTSGRVRNVAHSGPEKNLQADKFTCRIISSETFTAVDGEVNQVKARDAPAGSDSDGANLLLIPGAGDGSGADGAVISRADALMSKIGNGTQALATNPADLLPAVLRAGVTELTGAVGGQVARLPNYALIDIPELVDDDGITFKLYNGSANIVTVDDSVDGTGVIQTAVAANTVAVGATLAIVIRFDVTNGTYEAWSHGSSNAGVVTAIDDLTDGSTSATSGIVLEVDATNDNVHLGQAAGQATTTGSDNVIIGDNAGAAIAGANDNVLIGSDCAPIKTAGNGDVVIGSGAGAAMTSGGSNVLIGRGVAPLLVTESECVCIGAYAGALNNGSTRAVCIGYSAGAGSSGAANTSVGTYAGTAISTGNYNTSFGYRAGQAITSNSYGTFVGGNAGSATTGANNTLIGYSAGGALTSGGDSTLIGALAGRTMTGQAGTVAVGYRACGDGSGGDNNTCVGTFSGRLLAGGYDNTLIGRNAGAQMTTGYGCTFVGSLAGDALTSGGDLNTLVGYSSGTTLATAGTYNTFVGAGSGRSSTSATSNVFLGKDAAANNADGSMNVAVGDTARIGTTGGNDYNVSIGQAACVALTSGASNVAIGQGVGATLATGNANILIGREADVLAAGTANSLVIGSTSYPVLQWDLGPDGDVLSTEKTSLTDGGANNFFSVNPGVGEVFAARVDVGIRATDGTDFQSHSRTFWVTCANKAGTVSSNIFEGDEVQTVTAGTLTVAGAISSASPAVFSLTPTSSLTTTGVEGRVRVYQTTASLQAITLI